MPVLAVVFGISLATTRAEGPPRRSTAQVLAEFDVHTDGDGIVVPVLFGPAEYMFLVDTGYSFSSLDISLRSLVGPERGRQSAQTLLGTVQVMLYDAPTNGRVGGVALESVTRVLLEDFESTRRVSGHNIRGVLGMDFLSRYVVDLDPDRGKLRLLDKASIGRQRVALIEFANRVPYVVARIDGVYRKRFFIDTGYCSAASVGLSPEAFHRLLEVSGKKEAHQTAILTTASGERSGGQIMRIQSLSVGDATAREIDIAEVGADVLGLTFFSRFRTVLDFPNGVLYLVPGRRSALPDSRDRSGLHIWRISDRILVHSVDEGSPGAKAAIEAGDELLEIHGKPARELNLHKIRLMLRGENMTMNLILQRGRDRFSAALRQ